MANTITADEIREHFSQAMSECTSRKFRSTVRYWNLSLT